MEAVLLSITPSFINGKKVSNPALGKQLQEYKADIDKPLSAILTLNTIAHTVGAIGVGAQAAVAFGDTPINIPFINLSISYESLIATLMTLAILILSEIIPKTLGANYWRELTPITVKALKVITFILKPFVWLSMLITKTFKSSAVHSVLSRDDYRAMTSMGGESGALKKQETKIISNLLDLDALVVKDVMTPRLVIHARDESMTLQEYFDTSQKFQFSRIPIFEKNVDNLIGFVLKGDIFKGIIEGNGDKPLASLKREIDHVNETVTLNDFFKKMSGKGNHLTAVVDEYGALSGLVTMEDVLETLLGYEIVDESDSIEDLQAYARQKWEERAKKLGMID